MSNGTLPIITTKIDPRIDGMVATSGESPLNLATPQTAEVIRDAVRSSARILRLTCLGVQRIRVLLRAASLMTSVVWGVARLSGDSPEVSTIPSILGSIIVVIIGRVPLLNIFCCKSTLIVSVNFLFFPSRVWVATFGSLAGSPFFVYSYFLILIHNNQRWWLSTLLTFLQAHPIYFASHLSSLWFNCLLVYWAWRSSDWNYPQLPYGHPLSLLQ